MSDVVEATRDDFRELVADGLVLVDVWGPSCTRCIALLPYVEDLAARRDDLRVVKLEAPKARRICMDLKLMGLPAFLLFRDGEELGRIAEPDLTADRIDTWLAETVADPRQGDELC
ncbi:MAG: thioredoxin family protein [Acidimicrobiia bacterium]